MPKYRGWKAKVYDTAYNTVVGAESEAKFYDILAAAKKVALQHAEQNKAFNSVFIVAVRDGFRARKVQPVTLKI